jgi:hypothetical protein
MPFPENPEAYTAPTCTSEAEHDMPCCSIAVTYLMLLAHRADDIQRVLSLCLQGSIIRGTLVSPCTFVLPSLEGFMHSYLQLPLQCNDFSLSPLKTLLPVQFCRLSTCARCRLLRWHVPPSMPPCEYTAARAGSAEHFRSGPAVLK